MKKLFSLLVIFIGLFLMTSCGGDDDDTGDGNDNSQTDAGNDGGTTDGSTDDQTTGVCSKNYQFAEGDSFKFAPASIDELEFDDVPFPNNLFLDENGLLHLNKMPSNGGRPPKAFAEMFQKALNTLDGFGVTTGIFFSVSKDLDVASLPPSIIESGSDDKVLLFEVGGDGSNIPTSVFFADKDTESDSGGRLVIHPALGHVLKEKTTYALVIKKGIKTSEGKELVIAPELAKTISQCGDEKANTIYKPINDWMIKEKLSIDDIITATVFTTQTISAGLVDIYTDVSETPPEPAKLFVAFPNENHPLSDAVSNTDGLAFLLQGQFTSKRYVSESKQILAAFEYDANGSPKVRGSEEINFTILVPDVEDVSNLPLVIFQHGLNGSRVEIFAISHPLLKAGFAVACIDTPYHGSRAMDAYDEVANSTGKRIPDGFGDDVGSSPALNFVGVASNDKAFEEGFAELHPFIVRDSFRQAAADLMQLVTLFTKGDLTALKQADPKLSELAFDSDNLFYIGKSFGSIIGTIYNGIEGRINGAILNVGGIGLVFPTLMGSYGFSKLFGPILYNKIGLNYFKIDYDVAPPESDPWVNLYQMAIEPGDPSTYATMIVSASHEAKTKGVNLLLQHAYNDQTVPNRANEAQAVAAGIPYVKVNQAPPKLRYTKAETLDGEAKENINGITAAACQYTPAGHNLLTTSSEPVYVEEEFPPFKGLEGGEQTVSDPMEQVQGQMTSFFTSCLSGACIISDPY